VTIKAMFAASLLRQPPSPPSSHTLKTWHSCGVEMATVLHLLHTKVRSRGAFATSKIVVSSTTQWREISDRILGGIMPIGAVRGQYSCNEPSSFHLLFWRQRPSAIETSPYQVLPYQFPRP
jgi:hypothetical protein